MMRTIIRTIAVAGIGAWLLSPLPLSAQDAANAERSGLWLTTPFPEFAIEPGERESISINLSNENLPPQRASIEVSGIPEGWEWSLKGAGKEVTATIVPPDASERLTLEMMPPADAATGSEYTIEVQARTTSSTVSLPLVVKLAELADTSAGISLEPELPGLRGTASSTFSFKIKVKNEGAEDGLFNLAAEVPDGFQTRFKRGFGSEEITAIPVAAGATETVTLEVIPSRAVAAGRYTVGFGVSGNGQSGTTDLSLDVTGQPAVRLVGPQERLSGDAVAGRESRFDFTLVNAGAAPAEGLEMSATPPNGWKVEFEPKELASLSPSSAAEVAVKITPSAEAIAGDYVVRLAASGGPVAEETAFRVTVKTSTLWGAVGLGVVAVAVLVLGAAVMRYGRR